MTKRGNDYFWNFAILVSIILLGTAIFSQKLGITLIFFLLFIFLIIVKSLNR